MGDRRYDNTTRETRLCLCRGAHRGARTRLDSASAEPSLPRGLKGGDPLSPRHHFLVVSRKISTPNSLAYSDKSIVKNLRTESVPRGQKAGRAARLPTPLGYGNSVTPSVLRLNQNTKPYHEHHVYVLLHVINGKLNFIALILKLSSNLLLDQILSSTAQFTIVILMQL